MFDRYVGWVKSLTALTSAPEDAASYRRVRARITAEIAKIIVKAAEPVGPNSYDSATGPTAVIYGVYLDGHPIDKPVYIGQTLDPARRLRDLPIGESHHLANTFPPEIWGKVVIVRWADFLEQSPQRELLGRYERISIGLGLEHALQTEFTPLVNVWRKERSGTLRELSLQHSSSVGKKAQSYTGFAQFAVELLGVWIFLSNRPFTGLEWEQHKFGGVAFPSRCYERLAKSSVLSPDWRYPP